MPDPDIGRGWSVVRNLHVHLVSVTTYRPGVSDDEILTRCEQVMPDVRQDFGADLCQFNGEPDHFHLLVHHPPVFAHSRPVKSLKGVSSRRLRQQYAGPINPARTTGHLWAPSYLAASAGEPPPSIIKEYIRAQKRPD